MTTEEKATPIKYNALKHGILQQLVSPYEQDFYDSIVTELDTAFEPEGPLERTLVDRVGVCILRLHRSAKAENEFMRSTLDPQVILNPMEDFGFGSIVHKVGYIPTVGEDAVTKLLDTYLRYETTIENRLYKALHELQRVQAIRRGEKVVPPLSIDVGMSREE